MHCPICKTELVEWKQLRLETLDEHVMNAKPSYKMAYVCPNTKTCAATLADGKPVVFWNENGELYGNPTGLPFINNNDAPFGTFQRKINVEISKKDENKQIMVLPFWFPSVLSGMKIRTRWNYQSNEDGDILKRRLSFEYIRKDGVIHLWGLRMVRYGFSTAFRSWKKAKFDNDRWGINELKQTVERKDWAKKEWWRKVNAFFASMALKNLGEKA